MLQRLAIWSALFATALRASAGHAATELTVKLVKGNPSRCTTPPQIELPDDSAHWHRVDKQYYSGENDREIYFDIESPQSQPELSLVTIVAPGVKIIRAIVGRTDVPFHQGGDRISFHLVDDQATGQMMQTDYQSPRSGLPISFRHEWKMRRNGDYRKDPYPEAQVEAIPNYLVAAQEALRLMGYGVEGLAKPYLGNVVLMGSENANSRGHTDFPPHFHIMHYEFEIIGPDKSEALVDDGPSVKKWRSRLAPHFYMDDKGRVISNACSVLVGTGKSATLGVGQTCTFKDSQGHFVLDMTIENDGVLLLSNGKDTYALRPDPVQGPTKGIYVYYGEQLAFRVQVRDDAEQGHLRYQIDNINKDGKVVESFKDGFDYDPFTSKLIGRNSQEFPLTPDR
jgi:hypothetical protein